MKPLSEMSITELESLLQTLQSEGCWLIQHVLPKVLTWQERGEILREHNDEVWAVKGAIASLQEWPEEVVCG